MKAESGCNPNAYNPESHRTCAGSLGLMQIACIQKESSFDPATNIAGAYRIYSQQGFSPWGVYKTGAYIKYLN
jgi:soluble lytic murein transglycosylase-like protein